MFTVTQKFKSGKAKEISCNFCHKNFRRFFSGPDDEILLIKKSDIFYDHLIGEHTDAIDQKYICKHCGKISLTISEKSTHQRECKKKQKDLKEKIKSNEQKE